MIECTVRAGCGTLCSWAAAAFAPLLEKPNVTTRSMSAGLMPTPLSSIVSVKVFFAGSCSTSILIDPGCPGSTSRIASMQFSARSSELRKPISAQKDPSPQERAASNPRPRLPEIPLQRSHRKLTCTKIQQHRVYRSVPEERR